MRKSQKGFTLIELLVVIVIIGILAGVLISVINPAKQQARARNGTVRATIQKLAFALNTSRAGMARLPYDTELENELENVVAANTCTSTTGLNCSVSVSGVTLPATCTSGDLVGGTGGTNSCEFGIYSSDVVNGSFRVAAQRHPETPTDTADMLYVFDSTAGLFSCPIGTSWTSGTGTPSGCTLIPN